MSDKELKLTSGHHILVSGCSFTANQSWPQKLFDGSHKIIHNVATNGAGNGYIANSIMANVNSNTDFVFILWSGINRHELRVANSETFSTFNKIDRDTAGYKCVSIENSSYYLSGGAIDIDSGWVAGYNALKDTTWPEISSVAQWFGLPEEIKQECLKSKINLSSVNGDPNLSKFYHQYFLTQNLGPNQLYRSELTFQHILNCCNFLQVLNVPYRFAFIYDFLSDHHQYSLGKAVKERYYQFIDWSKFINLPPYDYGIRNDFVGPDGFHLTGPGYQQWSVEIGKILRRQTDLSFLFDNDAE